MLGTLIDLAFLFVAFLAGIAFQLKFPGPATKLLNVAKEKFKWLRDKIRKGRTPTQVR